jgi:hypothetical protein
MPQNPKDLRRRITAIRAARPALQRRAEHFLLDYYREHRKLPKGPLLSLVGNRRLYRIVARGEIEHTLRIAWLMRHARRVRDFIAALRKEPDA